MSSLYKAAILVCIIELLLTATMYVPFSTLLLPMAISQILEGVGIDNTENMIMIILLILYVFLFVGLFFFLEKRVVGFVIFSIAHYVICSALMFMWFTNNNNDGQAVLLIIQYAGVSAVLVLPIARVWSLKRNDKKQ